MEMNFKELFEKTMTCYGDNIALTYLHKNSVVSELTFKQLAVLVKRVSSYLHTIGDPQEKLLIMCSPCHQFMAALLGCFCSRRVAVPLYLPKRSQTKEDACDYVRTIAEDAGAGYLITTKADYELISDVVSELSFLKIVLIDELVKNENFDFISSQETIVEAEDLALLLYTSGSTGKPKGVMLTHHNIIHNMSFFAEHCSLGKDDPICVWIPNTHIAGIYTRLLGCCMTGARTVIFPTSDFLEDPLSWLRIISEYQIRFSAASNFAYDLCCDRATEDQLLSLKGIDLSSWRMAVSGGERIQWQTINRFSNLFSNYGFKREFFKPYYGLTETTCISIVSQHDHLLSCRVDQESLKDNKLVESKNANDTDSLLLVGNGKTFADTQVRIVDPETKEVCPENTIGEIWVSGASVCKGYWRQIEKTKESCQAEIAGDSAKKHYFRTGDLGFVKQSSIFITGRLKELIIIRGKNYYPDDIENLVQSCCKEGLIQRCVAFSVEKDGVESLAVVLAYGEDGYSSDEFSKWLVSIKSALSSSLGLRLSKLAIVKYTALPMTPTGKVQRQVCREKIISGEWEDVFKIQMSSNSNKYSKSINSDLDFILSLSKLDQEVALCEVIRHVLSDTLDENFTFVADDVPFQEFGLDSVLQVKFLMDLSKRIGKNIPIELLFDNLSIRDWACSILKEETIVKNSKLVLPDFSRDIEDTLSFLPKLIDLSTMAKKVKDIFFTGATGFLGRYLLHELLEKTEVKIHCLVRAENSEKAFERIKSSLVSWQHDEMEIRKRVIPVVGNLTSDDFGLSNDDFKDLCEKVDVILHNAADVNFVKPYNAISLSNVAPIKTLLQLAGNSKLKPIHFISTVAVFNSLERYKYSPVRESDRLTSGESIFSGYAQSKWVAEEILRTAEQKQVPVVFYRPGLVTGDSQTGYCHTDDFLCRFIKGCLQLGTYPLVDMEIDMSPVDYVSKAIVGLLTSLELQKQGPRTFHLVSPNPIKLTKFFNWLNDYGFSLKPIGLQEWLVHLRRDLPKDNALFPVMPFLTQPNKMANMTILELFDGHKLEYDFSNTTECLKGQGISCPEITDSLLKTYIKFFIESGFFESIELGNQNKKEAVW